MNRSTEEREILSLRTGKSTKHKEHNLQLTDKVDPIGGGPLGIGVSYKDWTIWRGAGSLKF